MTERKRARARWFNVYRRLDGTATRDKFEHGTRSRAKYQAAVNGRFNGLKLLYRIRVRRYLEPK